MSDQPAPSRRHTLTFTLVILGLAAFAVAYGQAPLYYSNQNQYFLHGLAWAHVGSLDEDWLANTIDPTPIFSGLVAYTAHYLRPWVFYIYQGLLLAIYAAAMLGLFAALVGPEMAARRWPVFLVLLAAVHSAGARWLSCRLLGLDYPWYFQAGVAGQYVLGGMFQPSVFGVLLVASVCLFIRGRPQLAVIVAVAGATVHSTYVLPAGLLTAGYVTALIMRRDHQGGLVVGRLAAVLVLPVLLYTVVTFSPSSSATFAESQAILVNQRIPHHCQPKLWLDPIAGLQVAWVGVALALVRRTPLLPMLGVPLSLAIFLTVGQIATGSHTLALLFPWRISAVLVPIATAIVVARLVSWKRLPLGGTAAQAGAGLGMACLAGAGIWICAGGHAFATLDEELPLLEYVHTHHAPGDLYLLPVQVPDLTRIRGSKSSDFQSLSQKRGDTQIIPIDLQRFRLATGAAIYVDFKSIPYKDTEVLTWSLRVKDATDIYQAFRNGFVAGPVRIIEGFGITHLVMPAGIELREKGLEKLPFENAHYQIYRVRNPSGMRLTRAGQLEDTPQARVFPEGKLRREAQKLVAKLVVAHRIEETEAGMLLRVVPVEGGDRQERLQEIPAAPGLHEKSDFRGRDVRGVLQGTVDLRLHERRLVVVGAGAGGEEVELMTVTARPVSAPAAARVEPQCHAVRAAWPGDVPLRRLFLAADLDLQGKPQVVPGKTHLSEVALLLHGREVVDAAFGRQLEQAIVIQPRHVLDEPARMGDAKQKAIRDKGHG